MKKINKIGLCLTLSLFSLNSIADIDPYQFVENLAKEKLLSKTHLYTRPGMNTESIDLSKQFGENFSVTRNRDKPHNLTNFSIQDKTRVKQSDDNTYDNQRDIIFEFRYENQQEVYIKINDPHEIMSQIHVFPKVVRPHVVSTNKTIIATLPTGEDVVFDRNTGHLVSGVLKSAESTESEIAHKEFSKINYVGKGLSIYVTRKQGAPRNTMALVTYKNKTCKVAGNKLWDMKSDRKGKKSELFLFRTNDDFYKFIEKGCKFNLSGLRKFEKEINAEYTNQNRLPKPSSQGGIEFNTVSPF